MKLALALSLLAAWQPAQVVEPFRLDGAQVAAGADGSLQLVAEQHLGADDRVLPAPLLTARSAPPGGALGPPRVLGAAGYAGVAAGVDATGRATALLTRAERLAVVADGAAPAWVSRAGRRTRWARLAVAPTGAAVAAWLERSRRRWRIVAAVREPGAPAFAAPETVSGPVAADTRITAAVGGRGDALLAWTRAAYSYLPAAAALRRPGGRFSAPVPIEPKVGQLRLAVAGDGSAMIALSRMRPRDVRGRTDVRVFTLRPNARKVGRAQTIPCGQGVDAAAVATSARVLVVCHHRRLETWEGAAGRPLKRNRAAGERCAVGR